MQVLIIVFIQSKVSDNQCLKLKPKVLKMKRPGKKYILFYIKGAKCFWEVVQVSTKETNSIVKGRKS